MKTCLIIGGGLAGLSAGVHLSRSGIQTTILERSPRLGGRASSFIDPQFERELDNGQHIIMGCYSQTLEYINLIGSQKTFQFQDALSIPYAVRGGKRYSFESTGYAYPFNLSGALFNYQALSFREQLSAASFLLKAVLPFYKPDNDLLLSDWFTQLGQGKHARNALWDFLAVGAMNTKPENASALMFRELLRRIFLKGNFATTIIMPQNSLNESLIAPAMDFIRLNGGSIYTSCMVKELIHTGKGVIFPVLPCKEKVYDSVIIAVPFHSMYHIAGLDSIVKNFPDHVEHAAIVTTHMKVHGDAPLPRFMGLIESPIHWLFTRGDLITTVTSDANEIEKLTIDEIIRLTEKEIFEYTGGYKPQVLRTRVIKEKRATFIPSPAQLSVRPSCITELPHVFLAGDWTNTGLPATIEGAILSGYTAAQEILNTR
ncbi:MAG: hydroxysqualene dehydroxylase HpnE [Ignavibacteria bacterium]|nr:hydroxysqualene dehydroxylase HpnE [Ignavibacteria bacterium]